MKIDRDYLAARLGEMQRQDLVRRLPTLAHGIVAELLIEASERFRRGDRLDGLTSVERALMPKWSSGYASEQAYYWQVRCPNRRLAA